VVLVAAQTHNLICGSRKLQVGHNTGLIEVALLATGMLPGYTPDNRVSYKKLADYRRLVGCIATVLGYIVTDYKVMDFGVGRLLDIDAGSQPEGLFSKTLELARRPRCWPVNSDHAAILDYSRAHMLNMLLRPLLQVRGCPETANCRETSCRRQHQSLMCAAAAAVDILGGMDSLGIGAGGSVVSHWGGHSNSGRLNRSTCSPPGSFFLRIWLPTMDQGRKIEEG